MKDLLRSQAVTQAHTGFHNGGVTLVDTRVWFGCDMASSEREHILGVWQSPQRDPGAEPLVRGSGAKPPKAGAFLSPVRPKEIANLLSFVL